LTAERRLNSSAQCDCWACTAFQCPPGATIRAQVTALRTPTSSIRHQARTPYRRCFRGTSTATLSSRKLYMVSANHFEEVCHIDSLFTAVLTTETVSDILRVVHKAIGVLGAQVRGQTTARGHQRYTVKDGGEGIDVVACRNDGTTVRSSARQRRHGRMADELLIDYKRKEGCFICSPYVPKVQNKPPLPCHER